MTAEELNRCLGLIDAPLDPHATASVSTPVGRACPLVAVSDYVTNAATPEFPGEGVSRDGFENALRRVGRRRA